MEKKEMKKGFWSYSSSGVVVLIPKKRGEGFLKQPIGHHNNNLSSFIDDSIRFCGHPIATATGLDGYLHLSTGFISSDQKPVVIKDIIEPLSEFLSCEFEYISHSDFCDMTLFNTSK